MKERNRNGLVYSTNPEYNFDDNIIEDTLTPAPDKQDLRVWLESKGRKGKTVTIIKGFKGRSDDLELLAREIKSSCGTGGSVKEGNILIQGNNRDSVFNFLIKKGYKAKKAGG